MGTPKPTTIKLKLHSQPKLQHPTPWDSLNRSILRLICGRKEWSRRKLIRNYAPKVSQALKNPLNRFIFFF